jgi:hypothetical protein
MHVARGSSLVDAIAATLQRLTISTKSPFLEAEKSSLPSVLKAEAVPKV